MHESTIRRRVSKSVDRGAEKLDEVMPDWHIKIGKSMTEGLFNIENWQHCIAGTLEIVELESGFWHIPVITLNGTILSGLKEAAEYGFVVSDANYDEADGFGIDIYRYLDRCWRRKIKERINASA